MEKGKVVLGALAGIAIGAVVGVLLAPDKGSETRRKISKKGAGLTDGLKDKYAGLKDKYNNLVDGVSDKLESFNDSSQGGSNVGSQKGSQIGGSNQGGSQSRTAGAGAGNAL